MSIRPTARGWVTLAVAIVAWTAGVLSGYPALIGLSIALTVTCIVAAVSVCVPVPVQITRTVRPRRVRRLEECHAAFTITNTSRGWPVTISGTDRVDGAPLRVDFPRVRGGESLSTEVAIPTRRRGTITFGPLTLERSSFADLLRVRRRYGQSASVLVEPRLLDAGGLPPGLRRGHIGADERIAHGGTDLVGLREYVAGDDLRRLHWATSARHGTLMVREDADPAQPFLTVLLDDRASSYATDEFDEAVDVAASLLDAAAAAASPARLVTVSGAVDIDLIASPARAGAATIDPQALERLATLAPHDGTADARALVSSPDVLVVVSGAHADLADLVLTAAAAPAGTVILVDRAPDALVSASGGVLLLRGPRAEDLAHAWRTAAADVPAASR